METMHLAITNMSIKDAQCTVFNILSQQLFKNSKFSEILWLYLSGSNMAKHFRQAFNFFFLILNYVQKK